ncbi:MAG TPA: protein kinase, partial [Ktedonobacteraceae bacterium]
MAEVELRQIGAYSITEMLRTSSTSTYYKGHHSKQRKKEFCIKRLNRPFTSSEEQEAFLTWGKQLKKLPGRNIERIVEAGFDHEHGYLVAEYAGGETLRQRIPEGTQMAPDEVKQLLSPIANALHYAHVNSVLHGNIQPANIFAGKHNDIIVAEFAFDSTKIEEGDEAILYYAPEQLRGEPESASDQYALAVMTYQWLCGHRPYEAREREALQAQQIHDAIPLPHTLNPRVSVAVENVIMRALACNPEERFAHVMQFSDNYLSALMGFSFNSSEEPLLTVRPTFPSRRPVDKITQLPAREENPTDENDNRGPEKLATIIARQQKVAKRPERPSVEAEEGETGEPLSFPQKQPSSKSPVPTDTPAPEITPTKQKANEEAEHYNIALPPAQPMLKKSPATPELHEYHSTPDTHERPSRSSHDFRLQNMITRDLCQGGVLSQSLPGYEERPAQIEMASVVAQAITENVPAIIEAGTGTGKTLSYLLPVVRSGKVAIVSTANKALQEQLFYKDIPFIQKYIKQFDAALVKGFGNYVCLDRLEGERHGFQNFTKNREFQRLYNLVNDPESSFMGDFETLNFQLPGDIRGRVMADSEQCAWSKCSFYSDCYVRQMRERSSLAQVIVVNHTLLLIDAAMGGFLLPEREVIILDEAHHLEEEATRSFTTTVSPQQ